MRNRSLHDALRDFALEAAALLTADVQAGAELGFDVEETGGRRAVLYNYRPRTDRFIGERWSRLRALPAFGPAAAALGSGASAYLRFRGAGGDDPEPALRAMLDRLYEDVAGFEFPEERFERVYAEVERTLFEHALRVCVVTPVRGVRLEVDRVDLGSGLTLARGDWSDAPPQAVWPRRPGRGDEVEPNVLCIWEHDAEVVGELPLDEAATRFAAVQTGLRLFKAGGVAIGPLGWARADAGPWQAFATGSPAPPRAPEMVLCRGEDEELREFLALVARAPHARTVAWALGRFEMGCERGDHSDALSDHLLALGALLGADAAGRADLPLRVAALCAAEEARPHVRRRVEDALAVERALAAGRPAPPDLGELGGEIEHHLRALLRDVLCGYLDPGLRRVADEILLASGEPHERHRHWEEETTGPPEHGEIVIRRLGDSEPPGWVPTERDRRAPADHGELEPQTEEFSAVTVEEPEPEPEPASSPSPEPLDGAARRRMVRSQLANSPPAGADVESPRATVAPPAEPPAAPGYASQLDFEVSFDDDAGVTPSADWDDPDGFAAAI